jgi:hypothetical protein
MFDELLTTTMDMAVPARLALLAWRAGTPIFVVS